jgi:cytochrome c-type biogenesis protein CcmI
MTMFWIGVGVSVGLLALILLWPRRRPRDDVDREAANVALYEQRRGELEVDLRDGRLSADEHAVLLAELGAGLVRDAAPVQGRAAASQATDASPGPAGGGTPSRSLRLALLGAMPVVAVLAYLELGRLEDVDLQGVAQQRNSRRWPTSWSAACPPIPTMPMAGSCSGARPSTCRSTRARRVPSAR